jgi:hypothetical protein
MTLVGLDLNASRARAVGGPEGLARPLTLAEPEDELPMAVCLQGRRPEVGRVGAAMCREWPHLVCQDFLPRLGTSHAWRAGRHRLDAARAVALVLEHLRPVLGPARAAAAVLPAYLTAEQAERVLGVAQKARLPVLGSLALPLAAATAAYVERPWAGFALVVDADEHALTWTLVRADAGRIAAADGRAVPHLGLRAWKAALLDAIAERCVRHSRRDPRDSGAAEQLLYDQLDAVFDAGRQGEMVEVVVRTAGWCQNLFLPPEQVREFCAPPAGEAAEEFEAALAAAPPEPLAGVWLTHAAGRLPGLGAAVRELVGETTPVAALPPDAPARTAHYLAARLHSRDLPHAHVDADLPLPKGLSTRGGATFLRIPMFAAER